MKWGIVLFQWWFFDIFFINVGKELLFFGIFCFCICCVSVYVNVWKDKFIAKVRTSFSVRIILCIAKHKSCKMVDFSLVKRKRTNLIVLIRFETHLTGWGGHIRSIKMNERENKQKYLWSIRLQWCCHQMHNEYKSIPFLSLAICLDWFNIWLL